MFFIFQDQLQWQPVPKNETNFTKYFGVNQRLFSGMMFGLSVEVMQSQTVTVSSGLVWSDCTYNTKNGKLLNF